METYNASPAKSLHVRFCACIFFATASFASAAPTVTGGWSRLDSGSGNANGVPGAVGVNAVAFSGNDLYVVGGFASAGGVAVNNVARWNNGNWFALGAGITRTPGTGAASVAAVAALGNNVYVGGNFDLAGGNTANFIARWDGNSWSSLGSGAGNGVGALVRSIAIASNGDVYAAGNFTTAGGAPANYVARWNGSSWSSLGSGVNNGLSASVNAVAVSGNDVYVGGAFLSAGTVPVNYVARWDGTGWSALGIGNANGVSSSAASLLIVPTGVVVGGSFTAAGGLGGGNGIPANSIAHWNGVQWSAFGAGANNGVNGIAASLVLSGTDLYVGGSGLTNAGGTLVNGIARWNGVSWSSLGSGAQNGIVDASDFAGAANGLAVNGELVYVGGQYFRAGGQMAINVGRWSKEVLFADGFDSTP